MQSGGSGKLASQRARAYSADMPRSGQGARFVPIGVFMSAICASCGTNLPGTTLGIYQVTGVLRANSCGSGLGAPNPWQFDVQLSETVSTLYWNWMDASPLLSGPRAGPVGATLSGYQVANVDTTDAGIMGPCDLQRSDEVEVTLGEGSPAGSFEGTLKYVFSPQEGADCSDQLSVSGGTYGELPCTLSYSLTASRE
jgi:hypothetical protein